MIEKLFMLQPSMSDFAFSRQLLRFVRLPWQNLALLEAGKNPLPRREH